MERPGTYRTQSRSVDEDDKRRVGVNKPTQIRRSRGVQVLAAVMAWTLVVGFGMAACTARAADDFLDPEVAFKGSVRAADERTVEVTFEIAPGYYLYREQFKFAADGAALGTPAIPPGKVK